MRCRILLSLMVPLVVMACSDGRRIQSDGGRPADATASDADAGADASTDGARPADARPADAVRDVQRPDVGMIPPEEVVIYAHSRDTLFSFSPATNQVEQIGPFRLPGGDAAPFMLDLAVDAEGRMFTTSDDALFRVDPDTAEAESVGPLDLGDDQLFALSFLAPGELGDSEVLVGATNAGAYYEVDVDTATTRFLGSYPDDWRSSGDIVSVRELGTFATVRRSDYPSDVLVEIGFQPGGNSSVRVVGPVRDDERSFTQLFGLAFWGEAMYGFSNAGELIEIDRESGRGSLVSGDTGTSQFWGAGVTTRAPILF